MFKVEWLIAGNGLVVWKFALLKPALDDDWSETFNGSGVVDELW